MKSLLIGMAVIFTAAFAQAQEPNYRAIAQSEVARNDIAQAELPNNPHKEKDTKSPSDTDGSLKMARVFFITPKDGDTVGTKFKVKMGLEGMKVRPAGEAPDEMTSGHHHLIIDGKPNPAGVPVPADSKNIHFGKGETETKLTLPPGEHTLTLQFADGAHRSFGEKMSSTIKITVK